MKVLPKSRLKWFSRLSGALLIALPAGVLFMCRDTPVVVRVGWAVVGGMLLLLLQAASPLLFHETLHLAPAARLLTPQQYRLAPHARAVYVYRVPRRAYLSILLCPPVFWLAVGASLAPFLGLLGGLSFGLIASVASAADLIYAWVILWHPAATHVTFDGQALILHGA